MSVDLNNLPLEAAEVAQPDFENYQDAQEFPPPVPDNTYNLKTIKVEIEKFENNVVTFLADHEVYDRQTGQKIGEIRFDRFSTKVFQRSNVPVSMAADMVRATVGFASFPDPRRISPRNWGDVVLSIKNWCDQGNFWQAATKWEGFCGHKDTVHELKAGSPTAKEPFNIKGMKKFPMVAGANGSGEHNDTVTCPTCGAEVRARAKVDRRIPKA